MDNEDLRNPPCLLRSEKPLYRIPISLKPRPWRKTKELRTELHKLHRTLLSEDKEEYSYSEGVEGLVDWRSSGVKDGHYIQVLQSYRRSHLRKIQKVLRSALKHAVTEVLITNPYF